MSAPVPSTVMREYVGTASELRTVISRAQQTGNLVAVDKPVPVSDHRLKVALYLATTPTPRPVRPAMSVRTSPAPVRARRNRRIAIGAAATVGLAVLGFVVYAVWMLVTWVSEHLATIAGAAVGVGVLLVLLGAHGPARAAGCCPCHRR